MRKILATLILAICITNFVSAKQEEDNQQISKPKVGMTFDELKEIYGKPNRDRTDKAFPEGLLPALNIINKLDGVDPEDSELVGMTTQRIIHFSLPRMTISPFEMPSYGIKNPNFDKTQTVGMNIEPVKGIGLFFKLEDMKELFKAMTGSDKELILHSPEEQNPAVYYSTDRHYVVVFWFLYGTGVRIVDLTIAHDAIDPPKREDMRKRSRIGMTFDELSEIYGPMEPSNELREPVYLLDHKIGVDPEDVHFSDVQTDQLATFRLPQMTIMGISAPIGESKISKYNRKKTIGIEACPIEGENFSREDMVDIFKALTKSNKQLIRHSPPSQNPEIYYSSDKRYIVNRWVDDGHTKIKILDRELAHEAIGKKATKRNKLTEGL